MYELDLEYRFDSVSLITTYRGTSGVVRMYADREEHDRMVAKAGGGGRDKRGTCLGKFLTESFQPELCRIARRAHMRYRQVGGVYRTMGNSSERERTSLYGMTSYYKGRTVECVSLNGACGWDSMVRVAEAIGLKVAYIAETKEAYIHNVTGLSKIYDRRNREAAKAAAKAAAS